MDLNPVNISLILAIGVILSRITDIIKFIDNLIGLIHKRNNKTEVYKIENSNLHRTSNPRFGFSFVEPRTWDRIDPDNEDGNRYFHPTKECVSFSISGIHDVFEEGEIYNTISNHLDTLRDKKRFKLLLSRSSGSYCVDYPSENTVNTEKISAWRLKYNLKDKNTGIILTVLEFKCNYDGICFTIYCQAPKKEFENFEDFFLFIISEFRVLGINSAPFARNSKQLDS